MLYCNTIAIEDIQKVPLHTMKTNLCKIIMAKYTADNFIILQLQYNYSTITLQLHYKCITNTLQLHYNYTTLQLHLFTITLQLHYNTNTLHYNYVTITLQNSMLRCTA